MRKIRILYNDPDATDSSSDDEESMEKQDKKRNKRGMAGFKHFIREIPIPVGPLSPGSSSQITNRKNPRRILNETHKLQPKLKEPSFTFPSPSSVLDQTRSSFNWGINSMESMEPNSDLIQLELDMLFKEGLGRFFDDFEFGGLESIPASGFRVEEKNISCLNFDLDAETLAWMNEPIKEIALCFAA